MNFLKRLFGGSDDDQTTPQPEPRPTPPPPQEEEPLTINEITPEELMERIQNDDDMVIVDMRQSWEYNSGHIPGAIHMFVQEIGSRFEELPKDKDIVFQCWHGNTSLQASGFLIEQGWDADRIASLSGGIAEWTVVHGDAGLEK